MNLPAYRSSVEYKEILRLLQRASTDRENFVWQTRPSHRSVLPIDRLEIDFVAREVCLKLLNPNHNLDPDLPLFVKLDHRSSVFKVTQYKVEKGTLHFSFPQEIKTLELRQHPRTVFHPNRDKTVSLRPSLGNHRDSGNGLNVRVMDVSNYGMGLIVSEQNRAFVKNNPIVWITHLDQVQLHYPVLAEVVYMSSETNRKQKDLKIGLKISGVLPKENLSKFLQ